MSVATMSMQSVSNRRDFLADPLPRFADVPTEPVYSVATSLDEVLSAWRLVHDTYVEAGLINRKPNGLHFVKHAVTPDCVVALRRVSGRLTSTVSTYADTNRELPLDSIYRDELNGLRDQGRRLMEVGLFADRCEGGNNLDTVLKILRFPYFFALSRGHDLVIGVHPHHAAFYVRIWGFREAGPVRSYATVKDNPAILLHLDVRAQWEAERPSRGVQHAMRNQIHFGEFDERFSFADEAVARSPLAASLGLKLERAA